MDRNQGRRLSAEEKLRVVVEGRQSGATISKVCRRHQVDHARFYRWERLARRDLWKRCAVVPRSPRTVSARSSL